MGVQNMEIKLINLTKSFGAKQVIFRCCCWQWC